MNWTRHLLLSTACFALVGALVLARPGKVRAQIVQNPDAGQQVITQSGPPQFQVGDRLELVYTNSTTVTVTYFSCPQPRVPGAFNPVCPNGVLTYAPISVAGMTVQQVATAGVAAWHVAQGY